MVQHWHKLPQELVGAPCLEQPQIRWDRALSNLISFKMSLLIAGHVDQMTFTAPCQHSPGWDSSPFSFEKHQDWRWGGGGLI